MKNLLILFTLIFIISCGNDTVVNNNGGNPAADFDIYLIQFNIPLLKLSTYTIKESGTNYTLLNDSLAVVSSSNQNKVLLVKLDTSAFFYSGLYSADYNGTGYIHLQTSGYYPIYTDLSPDGTKALFTSDAGNYLCAVKTDGTGLLQISDGIRGTETVPKFSPDSRLIAYFEAPQSLETALYTIQTNGTEKKMLMDSIYYGNNYTLDWAPDGTKILFQYDKNNLNVPKICTIDTAGNNLIDLAEGVNPDYSPNGGKICFMKNVNQGIYDIFVMNSDGTGMLNITNSPNEYNSPGKWSADGNKILFSVQSTTFESKIYIYNVNTAETTLLYDGANTAFWK